MKSESALIGILAGATAVISIIFFMTDSPAVQITLVAISMIFILGTLPLFWSVAMSRMSGLMAAAGLAFINTIGLIGGFVGPYVFGLVEEATGDPSNGFYVVISTSLIGVILTPVLAYTLRREDNAAAKPTTPAALATQPL
jgi:nitrate/nitrite transporter NarK